MHIVGIENTPPQDEAVQLWAQISPRIGSHELYLRQIAVLFGLVNSVHSTIAAESNLLTAVLLSIAAFFATRLPAIAQVLHTSVSAPLELRVAAGVTLAISLIAFAVSAIMSYRALAGSSSIIREVSARDLVNSDLSAPGSVIPTEENQLHSKVLTILFERHRDACAAREERLRSLRICTFVAVISSVVLFVIISYASEVLRIH